MPIGTVSYGAVDAQSGGQLDVPYPTDPAPSAGDLLVIFVYDRTNIASGWGEPTNWSTHKASTATANGTYAIFYMVAAGGESGTVAVNTGGAGNARLGRMALVPGGSTTFRAGAAETTAAASPVTNAGVTAATAGSLIVLFTAKGDGGNNTTNDYASWSGDSLTWAGVARGTTAGSDAAIGIGTAVKSGTGATGTVQATCTLNWVGISYSLAIDPVASVTHELTGTTAGMATLSGTPIQLIGLANTVSGQASLSGEPIQTVQLADVVAGLATTSGDLLASIVLDGTTAGLATLSGALMSIETHQVDGTVAGLASLSGDPAMLGLLAGTAVGQSAVSGDLIRIAMLADTVAGQAVLAGAPVMTVQASGSAAGQSVLSGEPTSIVALADLIAGSTVLTGSPIKSVALADTILSGSTLVGDLTQLGTQLVAGTVAGLATLAGDPAMDVRLSGTSAGASALSGDLSWNLLLIGTVEGTSVLAGDPTKDVAVAGTVVGATAPSGDLSQLGLQPISGTVQGLSTLSGALASLFEFGGTIQGQTTLSSTPQSIVEMIGQSTGQTVLAGSLVQAFAFGGLVQGQTTLSGSIDVAGLYVLLEGIVRGQTIGWASFFDPTAVPVTLHEEPGDAATLKEQIAQLVAQARLGGMFQGDLIVRTAIIQGIRALKRDPRLLDFAFAGLVEDELTGPTYLTQLDRAKSWFLSTRIPVRHSLAIGRKNLPAISVVGQDAAEVPEEATTGDTHYDTTVPLDGSWPAVSEPFYADYDAATGLLSLPADIVANHLVLAGMYVEDRQGHYWEIEEAVDEQTVRIATGLSPHGTFQLKWPLPNETAQLESGSWRATYRIECHAQEIEHLLWLKSVVEFILLRYRQAYLEGRGFERTRIQTQSPQHDPRFQTETAYTLPVAVTGFYRNYWPKEIAGPISGVLVRPTVQAPAPALPARQDDFWTTYGDEDIQSLALRLRGVK